jgi:DHA1 family bicyclomycin/chloramphenicol resistance-like MFS transporter
MAMTEASSQATPVPHSAQIDRSRVPSGWRLVLIVGGLSIFAPLCIDMYIPALPQISGELHASVSAVQLSVTGCLLGIAVGQLTIGPISDNRGRRSPLVAGLGLFVLSSFGCSLVSTVVLLDTFRVLQGLGGAAGIVIARAIVRDLFEGATAARFFSTLMLVTGLGPVIAPQIGALIIRFTSWRGIFVALGIAGAILLVIALIKVPETLPPDERHSDGIRSTVQGLGTVGRDRTFLGYALVSSLGFGAVFTYIAGSSFLFQNIYGLSPQVFGAIFGLNAVGLVLGAQVNGHFVHRIESGPLLTLGLACMSVGSFVFLGSVVFDFGGLTCVVICLFVVLFGLGFVTPNGMALALQNFPHLAGSASAIMGSSQFLIAAIVAPIAGLEGGFDAMPMAILMASLAGGAIVARVILTPGGNRRLALAVAADSTPNEPLVQQS